MLAVALTLGLLLHFVLACEVYRSGFDLIIACVLWAGWSVGVIALVCAMALIRRDRSLFRKFESLCIATSIVCVITGLIWTKAMLEIGISAICMYLVSLHHCQRHITANAAMLQMFLSVTSTCTYSLLASLCYSFIEGWSVRDSLYFCAISLSTVGLGDLTPKTLTGRLMFPVYASIGLVGLGITIYTIRLVLLEVLNEKISLELYRRLSAFERSVEYGLGIAPDRLVSILQTDHQLPIEYDEQLTWYKDLTKLAQPVPIEQPRSNRSRRQTEIPAVLGLEAPLIPISMHQSLQREERTFSESTGRLVRLHSARTRSMIPGLQPSKQIDAVIAAGITHILWRQLALIWSLVLVYYLVFSAVMSWVESWMFVDSMYFCFGTMTTIGFGDLRPMTTSGRNVVVVFLWLGMAAVTLLGSIIAELLGHLWRSMV
jgi:hypothetical protein